MIGYKRTIENQCRARSGVDPEFPVDAVEARADDRKVALALKEDGLSTSGIDIGLGIVEGQLFFLIVVADDVLLEHFGAEKSIQRNLAKDVGRISGGNDVAVEI